MKGNDKGTYYKFLTFAILATSWKCSKETTTDMGEPQDKIVNPRIALNSRTSRLLRGDVDIDMKEKYDILKDEIMNMEDDEDEYNFERRLKLLMQNDKFEKQFNTIRSNDRIQGVRRCNHSSL
ncbi:Plasmodium exported protein, unknown function [Plasmodium vivax]|uniref:Uncharacterized protein n=1 Tax=Plasmodium vivax TaxID=5855 RepID=A0A565A7L3_PLAVI|nr:Plasmodium exported protein, unknown function [Plasmodium vivax]